MKLIMENWRKFINEENPMDKIDTKLQQARQTLADVPDEPSMTPEPESKPKPQKKSEIEHFKVNWNVDSRFIRKKDYKESIIIVVVQDKNDPSKKIIHTSKPLGRKSPQLAHRDEKELAFVKFADKYMPEIQRFGTLRVSGKVFIPGILNNKKGRDTRVQTLPVQLNTGEIKKMVIPLDGLRYSKN